MQKRNRMKDQDFVTKEVSILLQKAGFNEPGIRMYDVYGNFRETFNLTNEDLLVIIKKTGGNTSMTTAPMIQEALRWIWDTYKIYVEIPISIDLNGKHWYFYDILDETCKHMMSANEVNEVGHFESREDAANAAIKKIFEKFV